MSPEPVPGEFRSARSTSAAPQTLLAHRRYAADARGVDRAREIYRRFAARPSAVVAAAPSGTASSLEEAFPPRDPRLR